jgi:hypothetical protein
MSSVINRCMLFLNDYNRLNRLPYSETFVYLHCGDG